LVLFLAAASCTAAWHVPSVPVLQSHRCRASLATASFARSRALCAAAAPEEEAEPQLPSPVSSDAEGTEAQERKQRIFLRNLSMLLLVLQNSVITLFARVTREPRPGQPMYLGGSAVYASELVKLPVCLALVARDTGGLRSAAVDIWKRVFVDWKDTLKMGVPALCYCIQNYLFFVAISNMPATSYQLWSQSKTLTTALFFVLYIGGVLRPLQWAALALLTAGVGLVQYTDVATGTATALASQSALLGIAAVLTSSVFSGFANIYLEKMMKKGDTSLWIRNVQLGVFSIPQTYALVQMSSWSAIRQSGLYVGFTPAVWMVVVLKALGGLIVAAVIKYADNILKTYATAVAIVLTCLLSIPLYGTLPTAGFLQGMVLVIASMFLYNYKPKPSTDTAK